MSASVAVRPRRSTPVGVQLTLILPEPVPSPSRSAPEVEDAAVMPPVAVTSSAEVRPSLPLILTDVIAAPSNAAMAVGGEIIVLAETAPADPAIIVLGRPTLEQPRTLAEVLLRLGQLPMSPRDGLTCNQVCERSAAHLAAHRRTCRLIPPSSAN